MKKAVALFALLVVSIAVVVLTTAHSQNSNSNSSKLRRIRADKRIANQYIVVLKDDADVEAEAVRLSRAFGGDRNGGYTYKHAIKGFSVRMSEERAANWQTIRGSRLSRRMESPLLPPHRQTHPGGWTGSISALARLMQNTPTMPRARE